MVDGENSTDNYTISIGAIINNLEKLRFVFAVLKTRKTGKHTVKKFMFVISYI